MKTFKQLFEHNEPLLSYGSGETMSDKAKNLTIEEFFKLVDEDTMLGDSDISKNMIDNVKTFLFQRVEDSRASADEETSTEFATFDDATDSDEDNMKTSFDDMFKGSTPDDINF